jgi:predicted ATPase
MAHLRSARLRPTDSASFPFNVPAIRSLTELSFDTAVTFFVGENGSGKSTLLEGLALAARLPIVGSAPANADATLGPQRALASALKLVWNRRTAKGFFLRAEDFFGYTKQLAQLRSEMQQRIAELDEEYRTAPTTRKGSPRVPWRRRSRTWSDATASISTPTHTGRAS